MAQNAYTFRYSLRNWHTYNQALVVRGGMTFWIDEAALAPAVYPLLAQGVKVHPLHSFLIHVFYFPSWYSRVTKKKL